MHTLLVVSISLDTQGAKGVNCGNTLHMKLYSTTSHKSAHVTPSTQRDTILDGQQHILKIFVKKMARSSE